MPVINSALGLVGLATRRQLDHAVDRKDRWHGLVREVFGQYYLKFRESSLGNMPELPSRYSADWEKHMRAELDAFLNLDLESVGSLLDACGYGTPKWDKLQETGFPALRRLLDEVAETGEMPTNLGNGHLPVSDEELTEAVNEDLLDLVQRHPDLMEEMIRHIDLDSGRLMLDPADPEESESFRQLQAHHEEALEELKRFRRGGRQALERIQLLQQRVEQLQSRSLLATAPAAEVSPDLEREVATLRKELRAREASSAALRSRVEMLESQLADQNPDTILQGSLATAQDGIQERDDSIVRLQAHIERLEKQLEDESAEADESAELRELRSVLKSREHEIEGLKSDLEQLQEATAPAGGQDAAQMQSQIAELQSQLKARDHSLQSLREELERLQNESTTPRPVAGDEEDEENDPTQLRHLLAARDQTISGLREQIATLEADLDNDDDTPAPEIEEVGDLQQMRNDLRAREHTIETLQEQIQKLEADLERVGRRGGPGDADEEDQAPATRADRGDGRLSEEVESLRRDLAVRDGTILDLRKQLHAFEEELGQARESLLAEVEKLKALTSGDLELKPSAELDAMDSDQLLGYARDVAEDLDVRRQTLDEGLSGIESVKDSYEESKRVYEGQEKELAEQLESLRGELESYQAQQERDAATGTADSHELIVKQREQLDLLSTRIRQLVASNQDLNESNKKMYENLEQAVKRVIPLRKQIEELDSLNEALQRYIRQTHDRTFTTSKLKGGG